MTEEMKWITHDVLGDWGQLYPKSDPDERDRPYDSVVLTVAFPGAHDSDFRILFEYFPDMYEYSGPKAHMEIIAKNATVAEVFSKDIIVGHSVHQIARSETMDRLWIDTTERRIDIFSNDIEFRRV